MVESTVKWELNFYCQHRIWHNLFLEVRRNAYETVLLINADYLTLDTASIDD